MKNFLIIIITVFCTLTAGKLHAQPEVRISKSNWDPGEVMEGQLLTYELLIKNTGDEFLQIKVRSSCECIKPDFSSKSIKPDKTAKLVISYDTTGEAGKKTEYIFIDSNDPEYPSLTWVIESIVISSASGVEKDLQLDTNKILHLSGYDKDIRKLYLFSTPNCRYCLRLKEYIIPAIAKKHNMEIDIEEFLLSKPETYERLVLWEKKFNDTGNKIPAVFIGNIVLGGKKEINSRLEKELLSYKPAQISKENVDIIPEVINQKLEKLKLLPILGAGFIDGLNPCAFAAIIFLISYLSMIMKKDKREIFMTGLSFSAGVFIAYFLLGIGLAEVLYRIKGFSNITRILYLCIGIISLLLAVLSFRDYLVIKKIQFQQMEGIAVASTSVFLKLPESIRWKMYNIFEKHSKARYFVLLAFITGMIISVLELVCTGQIYLPTIIYMMHATSKKSQAVGYLSLYSFMFIVPLLLIFLFFFWGIHSEKMDAFGKTHIKTIKAFNIILFLFFSLYMFMVAYGVL